MAKRYKLKEDNDSYKNQYHFKMTGFQQGGDMDSLNLDPDINASIKENPYSSNVEIEGNEIVLQPDLTALFKAVGNKHSKGGMDVYLKPESFIFSDDKSLSLSEAEQKLFELKMGGSMKKSTPAELVKKNIPPKDYNTLINNISTPHKDPIAKKSSAMMLEKYIETLGNIAYAQEHKKGLPDGVPFFSMGTAPVYNKNTKEDIMESKQYLKYGGNVKAQFGMINGRTFTTRGGTDRRPKNQNAFYDPVTGKWYIRDFTDQQTSGIPETTIPDLNSSTPKDRQDRYIGKRPPYPSEWQNYYDRSQGQQYTAPNWINPSDFYSTPGLVDYMKTLDKLKGVDNDLHKADDAVWGYRHQAALEKFFPNGRPNQTIIPKLTTPDISVGTDRPFVPNKPLTSPSANGNQLEGITADWEFTPWQKLSQLYNWGQYAGAKRYMPFRSRYNATFAEPSLLNPEQAVGDTKAAANTQIDALNSLNPILRNAQAANFYGQQLGAAPSIRSQYDNTNAQITNQFRQYNNQVKNDETLKNLGFDQQYYQQSVEARKNFDNLRSFLSNQAMEGTLRDVEDNQNLAYSLLTRDVPIYGYDWKSGNFYRNPVDIRDIYGHGSEQALSTMIKYAKDLKNQGFTPQEISALLRSSALTKLAPYLEDSPIFHDQNIPSKRRGGYMKRWKK